MYMGALESEVESLSAEVTRLRLMLHRVTQVLEFPPTSPTSASPLFREAHIDPMEASLAPAQARAAAAALPSLASLEQILQTYPVDLLELLAQKARGPTTDPHNTHRVKQSQPQRREHKQNLKSVSRDTDPSAELDSRSSSAKSSRSLPSSDGEQKRKSRGVSLPPHSAGSDTLSTNPALADRLRMQRRSTIAKAPSTQASQSLPEDDGLHGNREEQEGTKPNASTSSRVLSKRAKEKPDAMSESALARRLSQQEPSKSTQGIPGRPVQARQNSDIGGSVMQALRRQSATAEADDSDDSEAFLPSSTTQKKPASKETTASTHAKPATTRGQDSEVEMSVVSMGAINKILKFKSQSPAESALDPLHGGVRRPSAKAGDSAHVDVRDDHNDSANRTLVSIAAPVLEQQHSPHVVPVSRPRSAKGSAVSASLGHHSERVSERVGSHTPDGIPNTPTHDAGMSLSGVPYNCSLFGSVAQSLRSPADAVSNDPHSSRRTTHLPVDKHESRESVTSAKDARRRSKPQAHSTSMQPPSENSTSRSVSTANQSGFQHADAAAELAADGGELIFGDRHAIPVLASPVNGNAPSPMSSTGAVSPSTRGVRTPQAKRSLLQRIRDQADDSSDTESSSARMPQASAVQRYSSAVAKPQPVRQAHEPSSSESSESAEKPSEVSNHSLVSQKASDRSPAAASLQQNRYSPANRSMSYTAGDLYSLGIYTPQFSNRESPALEHCEPDPMHSGASQSASADQQPQQPGKSQSLRGQNASPDGTLRQHWQPSASASAAYDYDFGLASRSRSAQQSPASAASPLSWLRSNPDVHGKAEDSLRTPDNGGYMYEF